MTRALLRSGANIGEINTVRKHLSRIKGGRLARAAYPARVVTLAISDVPGDDPAVIGSGPTVPDPSTLADARAIVARYQLDLPEAVTRALNDPANESPKPGDAAFANTEFQLIARPADAFRAAEAAVAGRRLRMRLPRRRISKARRARSRPRTPRLARELQAAGRRAVILSGGELTVTIRGKGRGGPNQEYALALAIALDGTRRASRRSPPTPTAPTAAAARREDPAGAVVDGETAARARELGLDPAAFLADNDSTGFFERLGGLLRPGPTFTNVNDFRAIVVDSPDGTGAKSLARDDAGRAKSAWRLRRCPPALPPADAARVALLGIGAAPHRRPPISGCATTPAAASASRSATRTAKAGPPKAGGTCRRATARR